MRSGIGSSANSLDRPGHLYIVYQTNGSDNLVSVIGQRQALFLDSESLKTPDTINLRGYNESFGELLDVRFGSLESARLWLNPQPTSSSVYEVILTETPHRSASVEEIRTYLAIKYGINLVDYKQYVYKREKLWDGSKNKYNHRIFGLAQLSLFGLKPSKSMHSKDQDLIVSVSKRQRSQFRDGTYLLFGTNNNPLVFDHKTGESKKEWLVQTNKEQLKVNLSFKLNSAYPVYN